jgi:hypothetical protein
MPLVLHGSVVETCLTEPLDGGLKLDVFGGLDELQAVAPHALRLRDRIVGFEVSLGGAQASALLSAILPQLTEMKTLNLLHTAWPPDRSEELFRLLDALPQLEWLGTQASNLDDAASCAVIRACLRMPRLQK